MLDLEECLHLQINLLTYRCEDCMMYLGDEIEEDFDDSFDINELD